MSTTNAENQLRLANTELNRKIALLEEALREREQAGEMLQNSEKRYRCLFESAKDGILILDANTGKVVDANPYLLQLLGYAHDALCGKYIWELGVFKDIAASKDAFKTLQDNEYIRYEDLPLETKSGQSIAVEFVSNVYLVDHSKVIQCNIRDITAHKRAKAERVRLMAAIEQVGESIFVTDALGSIQFINPAFTKMTGYSGEEAIGQNPRILKSGEQDELFYRDLWDTISGGTTWSGRLVNKRKDATLYTEETTISPVRDSLNKIVNYVSVGRDITAHLKLTSQVNQAQKMEAIGLLAGGVAHDYNNMLTVILGYAELAQRKVNPFQSVHADLEEIIKAGKRSIDITRQLLIFARKQTIVPVVLDLNKSVESMLTILRRLIGENIELTWLPREGLASIKMDPSQGDQILVNLCLNARDAVNDVGKVTIETENVIFDEAYCAEHVGFVAGEYVMLAVSDDGCGMDKETQDQIFTPFFTSKEVGEGTGLGLSIVYGIVKQNNGFINVNSAPGKGSTFKIYLPRHTTQAVEVPQESVVGGVGESVAKKSSSHQKTVLVVEDEPALLQMSKMMLEKLGYRVLTAHKPSEAIRLVEGNAEEIHLLLTDVIMPEMNGNDLAARVQFLCPSIKIIFMSGYTAKVTTELSELDEDKNFIGKPFSMDDLAVKVQDALKEIRKESASSTSISREKMEIYNVD